MRFHAMQVVVDHLKLLASEGLIQTSLFPVGNGAKQEKDISQRQSLKTEVTFS